MFEDKTYENLLQEVLDGAPNDIDTRQGSIFYDAVSGVLIKIAKLYADLEIIFGMTTVMTAAGEALEVRAVEYGITRLAAAPAKYCAVFEGTVPEIGERFFTDGMYFVLKNGGDILYLESEITGESQNNISVGTAAVPVNTIEGLISAKFGGIYENGSDPEDDESLRKRILEKIAGPAENGNRQHYKTWCESVDGVGKARIFPLWNGENTVKAVLIDTVGKPCGNDIVSAVQNYIDPADKGMTVTVGSKIYTLGDGLGNGVANIGAHFTACAANSFNITVSFSAELNSGFDIVTVVREVSDAIESYLKELALSENYDIVVRISAVGAILSNMDCIVDYSELNLNGDIHNVSVSGDDVPVLNGVMIDEIL